MRARTLRPILPRLSLGGSPRLFFHPNDSPVLYVGWGFQPSGPNLLGMRPRRNPTVVDALAGSSLPDQSTVGRILVRKRKLGLNGLAWHGLGTAVVMHQGAQGGHVIDVFTFDGHVVDAVYAEHPHVADNAKHSRPPMNLLPQRETTSREPDTVGFPQELVEPSRSERLHPPKSVCQR